MVGYDRAGTRGGVFMPVIAKPFLFEQYKVVDEAVVYYLFIVNHDFSVDKK